MDRFFQLDNGFMRAMSKLADIIFASILWILFSIPIFTIGASTTALYYTSVKVIQHERSYVWKSFWQSFKENFRNGTILWVILAVIYGVLGLNIRMASNLFGETLGLLLQCIYMVMLIIVSMTGMYLFPVLSRFAIDKRQAIKLSLFMAVKHLPFSVIMIVIAAVAILVVYLVTPLILLMPVAATLFISVFMERVLKKYMPKEKDESLDQWYLE